jgi:hypothetical protein
MARQPRYWLQDVATSFRADDPAAGDELTGPWHVDSNDPWNQERFHGMVLEFRPTGGDPIAAWDVVLRRAPEGCADRIGHVVARVRQVDAIGGREVLPESRLQVSGADHVCSGMIDTEPSFTDLPLTPESALYLGDDGWLRARLGFHDATVFRRGGP